jgi:hypothetical protein
VKWVTPAGGFAEDALESLATDLSDLIRGEVSF